MDADDGWVISSGPRPGYNFDPLSERVIGAGIAVHKKLGPGFREEVYENALRIEVAAYAMMVGVNAPASWRKWNIVHELGHAFGLNHSMVDGGAVMASPHYVIPPPTAPQPDDMTTFRKLYP